ncbi:riboflavin biosynthesis protein RibF [Catenisphaera adipataccumulans]|jgi:riboflavin kinase/FMN adenylyltransferase|uniref:Riboflavin biosynthesis protein n=1 Tax=Catenisphaera adipataccumulans TaxID=700500 RepID=A0A7W8CZ42_9FIRM|nr:riboflavin biosynthesis protein RibF [Catenisphaera adipataccumulans]MBB5183689.1 riboflavin kinase/FMN adenylyltransferase [Catenisphaera adipataccumulans]
MEVVHINYKHVPALPGSVGCIGYFDGIHKGHQTLMKKAAALAEEKNIASSIVTFDPDPWKVFYPDRKITHLTTLSDRIKIAEHMNIDLFYILTFSREFAALPVDAFHEVLHTMKIRSLVCGFDFHYAVHNSGNTDTLIQQPYFDVHVIDSINEGNRKIASSRIEPLVMAGDVEQAARLLGYVYSIRGHVAHGYKRGTNLLKIPTANLNMHPEYALPAVGVYAGMVKVGTRLFGAMINIGSNPTFENETVTIEAHLHDFNEDIYGEEVRFYFLKKMRDEIKFDSFSALQKQLFYDIDHSRIVLKQNDDLVRTTARLWDVKQNFVNVQR